MRAGWGGLAFPGLLIPNPACRQFYPWPDLLQLYRDADVVVVPVLPNGYAAGIQGMMEAMACGRPTLVTRTEGLKSYLANNDGVIPTPPGDVAAMRQAIEHLLAHREEAEQLAQRALAIAQERHDSERHVEFLAQGLEALHDTKSKLHTPSLQTVKP